MAKTATPTKSKKAAKAAKPATKKAAPPVRRKHDREALMKQVVALRDEGGLGWAEIAAETGADAGLCRLVYMTSKVKSADRIKGTEKEVAKAIVHGRDKLNESWGRLSARTGLAQSKVQRIYSDTTGNDWRQGYKVVQERVASKAASAPAKSTKKAKASSMTETSKANKAKRAAVKSSRKGKKGSANPSKG